MRLMQRLVAAIMLVMLVAGTALGEVKTSDVMIKSGDEQIKGFLAEPDGKGPFPAIVVIQEWWGLNDWIKENARRFAEQGYVALAPDLYRGKVTDDPRVAGELRKGLPNDRAVRDLKAAADFLASKDNVNKERLGSIGWCMGGGYSLQLALAEPRIKACAICYGAPVNDPEKLKSLNAAVLGVFGEEDKGIPPQSVREFEAALKKAGKQVEAIHEYKAGHGFMRPANGPGKDNPEYREREAKDAWQAVDAFFAKTLQGK